MKLKNWKTGEIVVFSDGIIDLNKIGCKNVDEMIMAGWQDYEEHKEYWFISPIDTDVVKAEEMDGDEVDEFNKQIGNYFETREEAEKAVEKLKAWKRLKDRGFKFTGYNACSVDYDIDEKYRKYISQDVDLLFSGEDD